MREEKQFQLEEIEEKLEKNPSFVLVSYDRFKSEPTYQFRTDVLKSGGSVAVLPKRLFVKAAEKREINFTVDQIPGHLAVVFAGEDTVETTKVIANTQKDTEKAVKVIAGYLDGVLYDASDVEKLAKMPSKDVMRAQLLSTFEAPAQQTVSVMNSLLTSALYCLEEKAKKGETIAP